MQPDRPGGSARCEYERRRADRAQRWRARWGLAGAVADVLLADPRSTAAWEQGARGEEALGTFLERTVGADCVLMHDRRPRWARWNLDHVVVAPSGVWVIDAKAYRGSVEVRRKSGNVVLVVGGIEHTEVVDAARRHLEAVRRVVGSMMRVESALCVVGSAVRRGSPTVGGIWVCRPDELAGLFRRTPMASPAAIRRVADVLARAFPPALDA